MSRATWLDAFRLGGGIASLALALAAALVVEEALPPDRAWRVMAGILLLGLIGFSVGVVSLGRDVSRRWVAFGATVGFTPATRRPFLAFGTDRPALYGRLGDHAFRMRLVVTRAARGPREWLDIETDLLGELRADVTDRARAAISALEAQGLDLRHARVADGRFRVCAAFPEGDPAPLVQAIAGVADAVTRPT